MVKSTETLPIESDDASGDQDSGTQAASSPEDVEHSLEKETESGLEENLLGTSDHQIRKQTSIRRGQFDIFFLSLTGNSC